MRFVEDSIHQEPGFEGGMKIAELVIFISR